MTNEQKKTASVIQNKYTDYRRNLINTWRDYDFIQFLVSKYREDVSRDKSIRLEIENHNDLAKKQFRAKDIDGICSRLYKGTNAKKALINSVSLTEHYLQDLTVIMYNQFPEKLSSKDSVEVIAQQTKLISLIMDSDSKQEMIDKLIEERVRGIFYGNPIEFFERDKAKLGFDSTFKDSYKKALTHYAEVINRRNINIHNEGRVDRKYIRETRSTLKLGIKPTIDRVYLKSAIMLLLGIASTTTKLIMEKTLGATRFHKFILSSYRRFDKDYK